MSTPPNPTAMTSPFKITSSEYPYCTIEHLACYSPSISIYNWPEERERRQQHIQDCIDIGRLCRFNLQVISAASTDIHRYYLRHSIIEDDTSHIELIGGSLLLASKSEDTPRRLNDFMESLSSSAASVLKRRDIEYKAYIRDTFEFTEFRDRVMNMETSMLCTLEYDFHVQHVHEYACCLTKQLFAVYSTDQSVMDDLMECIFELSLHSFRSTLCLHWHVQAIAVTILFLSAALTKRDVQAACMNNNICTEEDAWYMICGVTEQDIFAITTQLIANADQSSDIIQKLNDTSVWKKYLIHKNQPQPTTPPQQIHAMPTQRQPLPPRQYDVRMTETHATPPPSPSPSAPPSQRSTSAATAPRREGRYDNDQRNVRAKRDDGYQGEAQQNGSTSNYRHRQPERHRERDGEKGDYRRGSDMHDETLTGPLSRHHRYDNSQNQPTYNRRYEEKVLHSRNNSSDDRKDPKERASASASASHSHSHSRHADIRNTDTAQDGAYKGKRTATHRDKNESHNDPDWRNVRRNAEQRSDGQPPSYYSRQRDNNYQTSAPQARTEAPLQPQGKKIIDLSSIRQQHQHTNQHGNGYPRQENQEAADTPAPTHTPTHQQPPTRIGVRETGTSGNGSTVQSNMATPSIQPRQYQYQNQQQPRSQPPPPPQQNQQPQVLHPQQRPYMKRVRQPYKPPSLSP